MRSMAPRGKDMQLSVPEVT